MPTQIRDSYNMVQRAAAAQALEQNSLLRPEPSGAFLLPETFRPVEQAYSGSSSSGIGAGQSVRTSSHISYFLFLSIIFDYKTFLNFEAFGSGSNPKRVSRAGDASSE